MKKYTLFKSLIWLFVFILLLGFLILSFVNRDKKPPAGHNTANDRPTVQNYDFHHITGISAECSNADITVTQTNTPFIKIEANSGSAQNEFTFSNNNGEIKVIQNKSSGFLLWKIGFSPKITINLPEINGMGVDLSTTSGNILLDGDYETSSIKIRQTSGDFKAGNLKAAAFTHVSTSGNCIIDKLDTPKYAISSTSGTTALRNLTGSGSIASTSGNITAALIEMTGPAKFSATSGDLRLNLNAGISANLSAKTASGDIDSNIALNYTEFSKKNAVGTIGAGPFTSLSAETTSGNIIFLK